ncbi:MAG: nucleotidyltransferase family protein [Actinomycetota bacterium]|nr:nucleotidyltransferase family protein [Actinomycetota bacterium]
MSPLGSIDVVALSAACERYGVAELAVFGSVATGEAGPDSDIDVLYVLRDGVHLGWAINDLSDELEQVLGRPVDLVSKGALHARLKDAVLAQAQVVYAA